MKKRLTYVPKGIIKAIPSMMIERKNTSSTDNILKIKTRQIDILAILKLLYAVKNKPLGFSRLYEKSQIRMKKSFLNYLDLVSSRGFIIKTQLEKQQYMLENPRERVSYHLTDDGKNLLKLFGVI